VKNSSILFYFGQFIVAILWGCVFLKDCHLILYSFSQCRSRNCADQRNTSTYLDDKYCNMRWPFTCILAAQVARNDLTTRYVRNLWRGYFSKVIAFFKVKSTSDLVQQGDLGGNVPVKLYFSKFRNSISYAHFYKDVIFVDSEEKHRNIC
jgi:hypothetical protein